MPFSHRFFFCLFLFTKITASYSTSSLTILHLGKLLWSNKPLCQCNNPNQTKSNQIRKSRGLMDTSAPGLPGPPERPGNHGEGKGELRRSCVHSLGGSLNSLWEWSWPSLERSHHLVGFLRGKVWTAATSSGRDLGWNVPPKHFRMDARGWAKASNQTSQTPWI